jgi:2-oxoisovalerate dehydrogenase E1 component
MAVFRDTQHLYDVLGALFDQARSMPEVSSRLVESGIVVRFNFEDPSGAITIDLRQTPIAIHYGKCEIEADVEFTQKGDDAHLFWLGELSLPHAVATRKVVARGSVPKAVALLPAIKPVISLYPQVLRQLGQEDLLPMKRGTREKWWERWMGKLYKHEERIDQLAHSELLQRWTPILEELVDEKPEFQTQTLPLDDDALKVEMLHRMLLIRTFEERLAKEFAAGRIPSEALHLSIGQEACAVGACFALRSGDYMSTTHRGHGHMIGMGAGLAEMAAEIFGKATGLCAGLGGAMHVTDARLGALGANGIVGASSLIAIGAALSSQKRDSRQVSLAFMGDGATAQGMFHEALNFAAVFNLPVIFFVENNQYAEFTPRAGHTKLARLSERAKGYGIPGETVDGNDVWAVYGVVKRAAARAREGDGPTLIEGVTYRWTGHSEGEAAVYRSQEEICSWKERDPLARWKATLMAESLLNETHWETIVQEVNATVEQAFRFAHMSPEPDLKDALSLLFSAEPRGLFDEEAKVSTERELTVSAAINEALAEEMARDDRVYLIGEDVRTGGYFVVTQGLVEQFGPERIIDTPISEYAIVGSSVGAAMTGMRPVAEIEFADFLTCCMDPLVNQAAKLRFMSGGQYRMPLVVRTPAGAGIGMAAQHSQSLEAWLMHIPGLFLVVPGTPYDAKGLLKAAIRSNNPVVFFENKLLYFETGPVPKESYIVPLGRAEVKHVGKDVTLVALGAMLGPTLRASRLLAKEGVNAEVVDPRTLFPCDWRTIVESALKTRRMIVVEGGPLTGGFGAECAARVSELAWDRLKAPVKRVAALDVPIPYNRALENLVVPDADRIVDAALDLLK